jgi:hypothetical protein
VREITEKGWRSLIREWVLVMCCVVLCCVVYESEVKVEDTDGKRGYFAVL